MSTSGAEYRLDGIYKQRQDGFYMQRVKLPAGIVSAEQARAVAAVSERFGRGTIHLTTRGSMEIHWLQEGDLPAVKRELSKCGLTSRGACGGAVRGITCGSQGAQGFPQLESLARSLQRHFTGNPRFERLPKKFKIGVEADVAGGRHLIQDVGLVCAGAKEGSTVFDIWIAGGLGREPRAGFLLINGMPVERIIPIIEAIISVYVTHAPPPKRLKFLAQEFGEAKLRQLIEAEHSFHEELPSATGLAEYLVTEVAGSTRIILPVFAGGLTSGQLADIAALSERYADGVLMVTADQDIALMLNPGARVTMLARTLLKKTGLSVVDQAPPLRVCPGNHECKMGLVATRNLAEEIQAHAGENPIPIGIAVSGCSNSCSQPQLADVGIVAARLTAEADGARTVHFDVYRRAGAGLGQRVYENLTRKELLVALPGIS